MGENKSIPKNLGIIMDGNGRWAEAKGLYRKEGHTAGIVNMINLAAHAFELGVENVICYSLSTENFKREKDELQHILGLVLKYFDAFIEVFKEKQVCAKIIGDLSMLPVEIQESLQRTERILSEFENRSRTIYIAIAYGARREILQAVNKAIEKGEALEEEDFCSLLTFSQDIDLIIRTGGEKRLSNFLLYQSSYAELYFSEKFFPDFSESDLENALQWFSSRERRYGKC